MGPIRTVSLFANNLSAIRRDPHIRSGILHIAMQTFSHKNVSVFGFVIFLWRKYLSPMELGFITELIHKYN